MKNLYETLGIDKGASSEAIKKAYRRLAQEFHPDKGAGNEELFIEVKKAYDILSNIDKRAQYDRGEPISDSVGNAVSEAIGNIMNMFMERLNNPNLNIQHTDMVEELKAFIIHGIQGRHQEIQNLERRIAQRKEVAKRVRRKASAKAGEDMLTGVLNSDIKNCQNAILNVEKGIAQGNLMLQILNDYEYTTDSGQGGTSTTTMFTQYVIRMS